MQNAATGRARVIQTVESSSTSARISAFTSENQTPKQDWMSSNIAPDTLKRVQTDYNAQLKTVRALSSRQYMANPDRIDGGGQLKTEFAPNSAAPAWNMDLKAIPLRPSGRMPQSQQQPVFNPFGAQHRYPTPPTGIGREENRGSLLDNTLPVITGKLARLDTFSQASKSADTRFSQQLPTPVEPQPNTLQQIHSGTNLDFQNRRAEVTATDRQLLLDSFKTEPKLQHYGNMSLLDAPAQTQQLLQEKEFDLLQRFSTSQPSYQPQHSASSSWGAIGDGRSSTTPFFGNNNVHQTVTARQNRSQDGHYDAYQSQAEMLYSGSFEPLDSADSAIPQEYKASSVPRYQQIEAPQYQNAYFNNIQKTHDAQDIHLLASSGLFSLENMALEPIQVPIPPQQQPQDFKQDLKPLVRKATFSHEDDAAGCSAACVKKVKNLETAIIFYKQQIDASNGMRGKDGDEKTKLRKEKEEMYNENRALIHELNVYKQDLENLRQFADMKTREIIAAREDVIAMKWAVVIEATKGSTKNDEYFRDEFAMLFRGLQGWATRYLKFPNEIAIPPPTRGWLHEICGGEEYENLITSSKTKAFIVAGFMGKLIHNYIVLSPAFNSAIINKFDMDLVKDGMTVADVLDQVVSKQCEAIGRDLFGFVHALISRPYDSVLIDQCQKNLISLCQQAGRLQLELRKVENERQWALIYHEVRTPFSNESMQCVDTVTLGEDAHGEQKFKEKVEQGRAFVKSCSIPTLTRSIKEKDGSVKVENTVVIQKAEVLLL